jgi:hypothetical protein
MLALQIPDRAFHLLGIELRKGHYVGVGTKFEFVQSEGSGNAFDDQLERSI